MINRDSPESFDFLARRRQRANDVLSNEALTAVRSGLDSRANVIEVSSLRTFRNGTLAEDILDTLSGKSEIFRAAIDNFTTWDRRQVKDESGNDRDVKVRTSVCSFADDNGAVRDFWLVEERGVTGSGPTEAELNFTLSLVAVDPVEPEQQLKIVG